MREPLFWTSLLVLAACEAQPADQSPDAASTLADDAARDAGPADAPPGSPLITAFVAQPGEVGAGGGDVQLSWNIVDADSVSIAADVGTDPGAVTGTSTTHAIAETTRYTLSATNEHGTASRDLTVRVTTIGEASWTKQYATGQPDRGEALAVDNAGHVYVAGTTGGSLLQTGPGPLDTPNGFLVKYDSAGTLVWGMHVGTTAADWVTGVAVAPTGDVYVAGTTAGTFAGQQARGIGDAFVAKYTSAGSLVWVRQFGTATANNYTKLALDSSGNVYTVAETEGALAGSTNQGYSDVVIAKLSSSGTLVWERQIGTSGDDEDPDVVIDSAGNLYIEATEFVAKVSPDGVTEWTRPNTLWLRDLALAPDGTIFITGGVVDGSDNNVFILGYDQNGNLVWQMTWTTPESQTGYAITIDRDGDLIVGGPGRAVPGQTNIGSTDGFVVKIGVDKTVRWARLFGTTAGDSVNDVVVDRQGNLYATGTTGGVFSGHTGGGFGDGFLVRYR